MNQVTSTVHLTVCYQAASGLPSKAVRAAKESEELLGNRSLLLVPDLVGVDLPQNSVYHMHKNKSSSYATSTPGSEESEGRLLP